MVNSPFDVDHFITPGPIYFMPKSTDAVFRGVQNCVVSLRIYVLYMYIYVYLYVHVHICNDRGGPQAQGCGSGC